MRGRNLKLEEPVGRHIYDALDVYGQVSLESYFRCMTDVFDVLDTVVDDENIRNEIRKLLFIKQRLYGMELYMRQFSRDKD